MIAAPAIRPARRSGIHRRPRARFMLTTQIDGLPLQAPPMSSPRPLTDRQRQVLTFIVSEVTRCGMPPTRREICAHLGLAPTNLSAVRDHVLAVIVKGYLEQDPALARGLRVTSRGEDEVPVPDVLVLLTARGRPAIASPAVASYRPINPACLQGPPT